MKIEGGCLCGKVRYAADVDPAFVGICHCKDCQKMGTAFNLVVGIPTQALSSKARSRHSALAATAAERWTAVFARNVERRSSPRRAAYPASRSLKPERSTTPAG